MVWMLARSEASPASQPGPGAHKSHNHRWGREVLQGRAGQHGDTQTGPGLTRKCHHQPSTAGVRGVMPHRHAAPARAGSVLPRLAAMSRVARTRSPRLRLRAGVTRARPSLTNCRICPPFCPSENNVPSNGKPRPAETLEPALPSQLFTASHLQY